MSIPTTNKGYIDAQTYESNPTTQTPPDSVHQEHEIGVVARVIERLSNIFAEVTNSVYPYLPTLNQKAALDATGLSASNRVASMNDLTAVAAAVNYAFYFRTAVDAPTGNDIKFNQTVQSSTTIVNINNVDFNGMNISNNLMKLGANDSVTIQAVAASDRAINFDVTGAPTQIGGSGGPGYVSIPVTFFSSTAQPLTNTSVVILTLEFDGNNTRFLQKAGNLNDLSDKPTSRSNLGLGSAALNATGDFDAAGAASTVQGNLNTHAGLTGTAAHGLGNSSTKNVGATPGTVAAGDDSRFPAGALGTASVHDAYGTATSSYNVPVLTLNSLTDGYLTTTHVQGGVTGLVSYPFSAPGADQVVLIDSTGVVKLRPADQSNYANTHTGTTAVDFPLAVNNSVNIDYEINIMGYVSTASYGANVLLRARSPRGTTTWTIVAQMNGDGTDSACVYGSAWGSGTISLATTHLDLLMYLYNSGGNDYIKVVGNSTTYTSMKVAFSTSW